jgi:hypothetical protein
MIRAYTTILAAVLLFIGVVQVDRYMLIETVPASEVRIKYWQIITMKKISTYEKKCLL